MKKMPFLCISRVLFAMIVFAVVSAGYAQEQEQSQGVILTLTPQQAGELSARFGSDLMEIQDSTALAEFFGPGAYKLRRIIRDLPTADPDAMSRLQEIGADRKFVLYSQPDSTIAASVVGKSIGRRLAKIYGRFTSVEVEPNNIYLTQAEPAADGLPNDPLFDRQYWLNNFRQLGNDINILPVWKKFPQLLDPAYKGPRVPLYVLDGGISPHPELACLDIASSKSFMGGKPPSDALDDRIPHGTHLGGIICAQAGNEIGIAGIGGLAIRLVSFKVAQGSWSGSGPSTQAALNDDGILEALYDLLANTRDNQLAVVNASWGGFAYSASLHDAIKANKRVIFVAASGNNFGSQVHYPCALPETLCVSALDQYNTLASFANYDSRVDIMAFGETIVSLFPNNDYYTLRGTSQATPMVAATAALLVWRAMVLGADMSKVSREMVITAIVAGGKPLTLDVSRNKDQELVEIHRLDVTGAMSALEKMLEPLLPSANR